MKIHYTLIILISIAFIFSSFAVWSYVDWRNASDYWSFAPDGKYIVFICNNIGDGRILFPICEHSGGDLHGFWDVAINVSVPDSIKRLDDGSPDGYAIATLKGNVIVNLEATEP